MSSEKKIEANRRNAQRSTGPVTPEGRARVSQNAVTHGLRARRTVLATENPAEFAQLCADFFAEWQPLTHTELDLVEQMCVNKWKLARMEGIESQACLQSSLVHLAFHDRDDFKNGHGAISYPDTVAKREMEVERSIARHSQHISRLERAYFRALEVLTRMQERRLKRFPLQTGYSRPTVEAPPQEQVRAAAAGASAPITVAPKPAGPTPLLIPGKRRFGGSRLHPSGLPDGV